MEETNTLQADLGALAHGRITTFLATYRGGIRMYNSQPLRTLTMKGALELATQPGDTVQVLPGKYWPQAPWSPRTRHRTDYSPFIIKDCHGQEGRPITIRGVPERCRSKPVLCGSNAATPRYPDLPEAHDFAFFQIIDSDWITIDGFRVESCWPCFVYIENSRHITIRNITAVDGVYLVFARGKECSDLVIEDCIWRQDPTGAIRDDLFWADIHGDEGTPWNYTFYNGGLFGSKGILGNVIIRRNQIRNAYNGIRMRGARALPRTENINVRIYDNTFRDLRDNAIEPEGTAYNWYVHGNRFINVHNPFSLDRVSGGHWFFFGNVGWFTRKNGPSADEHTGGKILKFSQAGPFPQWPVFFFNNSWYTRALVVKSGQTRNLNHINNAIQLHPSRTNVFGDKFRGFHWLFGNRFNHDLTNGSLKKATRMGQELNGIRDPGFRFRNPAQGDMVPEKPRSQEEAFPLVLKAGLDWPGPDDWSLSEHNQGLRIGAVQEHGLVQGPPFVPYTP